MAGKRGRVGRARADAVAEPVARAPGTWDEEPRRPPCPPRRRGGRPSIPCRDRAGVRLPRSPRPAPQPQVRPLSVARRAMALPYHRDCARDSPVSLRGVSSGPISSTMPSPAVVRVRCCRRRGSGALSSVEVHSPLPRPHDEGPRDDGDGRDLIDSHAPRRPIPPPRHSRHRNRRHHPSRLRPRRRVEGGLGVIPSLRTNPPAIHRIADLCSAQPWH